jgi:hypothetical protein
MGVPIPPPPPLNILSLCLYAGFTRAELGATGLQSVFASTVNVGADRPDTRKGARLGTAMAISGAAASPNMGFNSKPALAFLKSVRLSENGSRIYAATAVTIARLVSERIESCFRE